MFFKKNTRFVKENVGKKKHLHHCSQYPYYVLQRLLYYRFEELSLQIPI